MVGLKRVAVSRGVILEVSVKDAAGKQLWSGLAVGTARSSGEVVDLELHRSTMSSSMLDAFRELFRQLRPVTGSPAK